MEIERMELTDEERRREKKQFRKMRKAGGKYEKVVRDCEARTDTKIEVIPGGRLLRCERTGKPCRVEFCPRVNWPN